MNNNVFNVRTRRDKKTGSLFLILEGETGINYIERIKERISSCSLESNEIVIELKNIVSFDLSTFQLLYSLRKTMTGKGKTVKIYLELPEATRLILDNTCIRNLL